MKSGKRTNMYLLLICGYFACCGLLFSCGDARTKSCKPRDNGVSPQDEENPIRKVERYFEVAQQYTDLGDSVCEKIHLEKSLDAINNMRDSLASSKIEFLKVVTKRIHILGVNSSFLDVVKNTGSKGTDDSVDKIMLIEGYLEKVMLYSNDCRDTGHWEGVELKDVRKEVERAKEVAWKIRYPSSSILANIAKCQKNSGNKEEALLTVSKIRDPEIKKNISQELLQ